MGRYKGKANVRGPLNKVNKNYECERGIMK